jgi:hypothetical protein
MVECASLAEAFEQAAGTPVTVHNVRVVGVFKADKGDRLDINVTDQSCGLKADGNPSTRKFKVWEGRAEPQQGSTISISGKRKDFHSDKYGKTFKSIETNGDAYLNVGVAVDPRPTAAAKPAPSSGGFTKLSYVDAMAILDKVKKDAYAEAWDQQQIHEKVLSPTTVYESACATAKTILIGVNQGKIESPLGPKVDDEDLPF